MESAGGGGVAGAADTEPMSTLRGAIFGPQIRPDNPSPASDRRAFEAWFLEAYPLPRTKAQQGNWKAKQRVAWTGWVAARRIPKPPLDCGLTWYEFSPLTPLTPEDLIALGETERRIAKTL